MRRWNGGVGIGMGIGGGGCGGMENVGRGIWNLEDVFALSLMVHLLHSLPLYEYDDCRAAAR